MQQEPAGTTGGVNDAVQADEARHLDLRLDFTDVLRRARSMLVVCTSSSVGGVLSEDWARHVFDLDAIAFCLGRTASRQRSANGLWLARDGRGFADELGQQPALVQNVLVALVGALLEREYHPAVLSRAAVCAVALDAAGVSLHAVRGQLEAAAKNQGDALSVDCKLSLAHIVDHVRELPEPVAPSDAVAELLQRCPRLAEACPRDALECAVLAVRLDLVRDPAPLFCDVVAPAWTALGCEVEANQHAFVALLTEMMWRYDAPALAAAAPVCLRGLVETCRHPRWAVMLMEVAYFWATEATEAAAFPYLLGLVRTLLRDDGDTAGDELALLQFLVDWNRSPLRNHIPKLTMLAKTLPATRAAAGPQRFRGVLQQYSALLRAKAAGVENLVQVGAHLEKLVSEEAPFALLFERLIKRFSPYTSLLHFRLLDLPGLEAVKRTLVINGNRADLAAMYNLQPVFSDPQRLGPLVAHMLRYGGPGGPASQEAFSALCGLLALLHELGTDDLGLVERVTAAVVAGQLTREAAARLTEDASRLLLFKTLYPHRPEDAVSEAQLREEFERAFPAEVLGDAKTMRALHMLSKRIFTIRAKGNKYAHVADAAVAAVQQLLAPGAVPAVSVRERRAALEAHVRRAPANVAAVQALVAQGYAPNLFASAISTLVTVEGSGAAEEALRARLLEVYAQYVPLLKNAKIATVAGVPLERLFDTFASMEQLQGERALVARALGPSPALTALLEREASLAREAALLELAPDQAPSSKRTYRVRLNNTFLHAVASCDRTIKGCYEPAGAHAEKPIECGLKVYNRLWSLLDGDEEIESLETVFTDEGMYVFRAYATTHTVDTSSCWAALFKRLLVGGYVPRVIVPRGYPTERCFRLLNAVVPSTYSRIEIAFADTLFEHLAVAPSYYDGEIIDAVKPGDLVICAEDIAGLHVPVGDVRDDTIVLAQSGDVDFAPRRTVAPAPGRGATLAVHRRRDLTQETLARVMRRIKDRALGRHIAAYVASAVEGAPNAQLLRDGVDWERYLGNKDAAAALTVVDDVVLACRDALAELYEEEPAELFFALREHYRVADPVRFARATRTLLQRLRVVALHTMPLAAQQSLLRWAYRNEGRVWLLRGGRPGEETVDTFLALARGDSVPGVALYDGDEVVGYALGEFTSDATEYEVITAWVHTRYNGLGLALRLYFDLLACVYARGVRVLRMDVIEGGLDRALRASLALRVAQCALIVSRTRSYATEREQFEAIRMNARVLYWVAVVLTLLRLM